MSRHKGATHAARIVLLSVLAALALGATDATARYDKDSRAMMCVCGCAELLNECNHVGCPDSGPMLAQLKTSIAEGKSDSTIFHEFQQQYGPVVLASPMFTPFNHLAWIVPPVVLFLGIGGAMLIVRKWKSHAPSATPQTSIGPDAVRDRIRRETEL